MIFLERVVRGEEKRGKVDLELVCAGVGGRVVLDTTCSTGTAVGGLSSDRLKVNQVKHIMDWVRLSLTLTVLVWEDPPDQLLSSSYLSLLKCSGKI